MSKVENIFKIGLEHGATLKDYDNPTEALSRQVDILITEMDRLRKFTVYLRDAAEMRSYPPAEVYGLTEEQIDQWLEGHR